MTLDHGSVAGSLQDGGRFAANAPDDPSLIDRLVRNKVTFSVRAPEEPVHPLLAILVSWAPVILLAIPLFVIARRQAKGWRTSTGEMAQVVVRLDKLADAVDRLARQGSAVPPPAPPGGTPISS